MSGEVEKIREILLEDQLERELLERRRVFLWGAIDDKMAEKVVKRILYLEEKDSKAPITVLVNSPGGVYTSGMAIYDVMQGMKSPIRTVCMGQAASFGAVILCAGTKGKRVAWPHANVMIHQPLIAGKVYGPASDINIEAEQMMKVRDELDRILAKHTGQPMEKIEVDTDRNYYMTAEEAKAYGLVDEVGLVT